MSKTIAHDPLTVGWAAHLFAQIVDLHTDRDPAAVRRVFMPDAVYEDASWPAPARGHDEVTRLLETVWRAFPDFSVELVSGPFVAANGSFAVCGRVRGTMLGPLDPPGLAPTHAVMATYFAGFYEFEGERLRYGRVILDTTDIGRQLSAVPLAGSAGERLAVVLQRLQARRLRMRTARGDQR